MKAKKKMMAFLILLIRRLVKLISISQKSKEMINQTKRSLLTSKNKRKLIKNQIRVRNLKMVKLLKRWKPNTQSSTIKEEGKLMNQLWSKFAIWVMDVGLIITLPLRFKLDNIDLQRLLSEPIIIHLQIFGLLLAQYLKWLQEISYLNLEKVKIMIKMMIILLKWWNFWEECLRI